MEHKTVYWWLTVSSQNILALDGNDKVDNKLILSNQKKFFID